MAREFKLPDLGEGLTDAEVVRVLVREGQAIKEDQPVLVVETEKAQVELPSPFGGRVAQIHVREGERVKVGAVLLSFHEDGGGRPGSAPSGPGSAPGATRAEPTGLPPAATPSTRRLARELQVDLAAVPGTGPGGRITDDDVRRAAGQGPREDASRVAEPSAVAPAREPAPARVPLSAREGAPGGAEPPEAARPLSLHPELPPLPRFEQWGPVEREPLRGVRRRSAEHLALAWSLIPHVTQHDQADITTLDALRRRSHGLAEGWGGDLTLTVFLVKAVALVLQAYPRFNASLDHRTGEVVKKRYYHIGVAVDTERGLVVPVVREADRRRLRELAVEIGRLVARTREGTVSLDELRGGTFTVTNTGALGGTGATPIINYPEVAILGVGRARETPVVRDGQVVIRLILPLSLGFDHRVIDGMEAARFMTDLVRLLEEPDRLLLES